MCFDEGQGQRGEHLPRHRGGVLDVGEALEDDGELIAAEAGHGIGFAHDGGQALGDAAQHVVAGAMAEPIVDLLEIIDVDVQQGQRAVLPLRAGCGMGQAILEQIAVGKVGQQIEVGLVGELLEPGLALDGVAHGAQQRLPGVSSADPEILRPVADHGQLEIHVRQKGQHDDRDARRLQQEPIDALRAWLSKRQRPEQDDIEQLARQPFDGGGELLNMDQIDQPGARIVEHVSREDGAVDVPLEQQRPNRSQISHP